MHVGSPGGESTAEGWSTGSRTGQVLGGARQGAGRFEAGGRRRLVGAGQVVGSVRQVPGRRQAGFGQVRKLSLDGMLRRSPLLSAIFVHDISLILLARLLHDAMQAGGV